MKIKILSVIICLIFSTQFGFLAAFRGGANLSAEERQVIQRIFEASIIVNKRYYDTARINPLTMIQEGFFEIAKEIPELLPKFELNSLYLQMGAQNITIDLKNIKTIYDILKPTATALTFVKKHYKGDKKFEDIEYAFIAGMLVTLDPHSNILPPKVFEEFKTSTEGEYGGLGIVISIKNNELTVVSPIDGTPAMRAGIEAEDQILQIGEQSTVNMPLRDAVDMMRGKVGTSIVLKIKSKGRQPRDVVLTRELIILESIKSKLVKVNTKNIGVVRVTGFQRDTFRDLVKSLQAMEKEATKPLDGIVLDLRNNPGGLLQQAQKISDKFLSQGDIVYTVGAENEIQEVLQALPQETDITAPVVVLLNEGSASASEIVAGALKDNNRAVIVGTRSFGKGSVQSLLDLSDGSSLKLTISQYLTGGKNSIQAVGVVPDIYIYPSLIPTKSIYEVFNKNVSELISAKTETDLEEHFDLFENSHYGEEKLDSHLKNQNLIKEAKPFYRFTFLKEAKTKPENQYVSQVDESDFYISLATKLLAQTKANEKNEMLKEIQALLVQETEVQDQKIIQALSEHKINWSKGQKTTTPKIEVTHQFLNSQNEVVTKMLAGDLYKLRIHVKNLGDEPLHRVLGNIESLNPLLDQKEFIFGKVEAKTTSSYDLPVKVPDEFMTFKEEIALSIFTENTLDKPLKTFIATKFLEKTGPQLAYSYQILDGQVPESSGNQNGIPEKNEKIIFRVTLKNQGKTTADKAFVNIKNKEGDFVLLKKARETIDKLAPQQSVTKDLAFDVRELFNKEKFEIDFFANDEKSRSAISDKISFDIAKQISDPQQNVQQVLPVIDILPSSEQKGGVYQLKALITHDKALKDIAIFSKGKKKFYLNLEQTPNNNSKEISLDLPLEDEMNFVLIQVRDLRDLTTRKTFSVVYKNQTP